MIFGDVPELLHDFTDAIAALRKRAGLEVESAASMRLLWQAEGWEDALKLVCNYQMQGSDK
jgi:ATP/maltotriose-dependent transcriptional regulator MalT